MSEINLRRLALEVMTGVWEHGRYLSPTLDGVFDRYGDIDRRGRAFLTRLCFGTEEKLIFLDEVIGSYSSTPIKKMRPAMRGIMRLSVYQIFFMDSVPDHAIVSEAVSLAKKKGLFNLSGFVNGVLRSILRDGRDHEAALKRLIDKKSGDDDYETSVRYSIPEWMIRLWRKDYGDSICKEICEGFMSPSPLTFWTNTDPVEIKKTDSPNGSVKELEGFLEGGFYVMDESSMQPVFMAGIKPGDVVLDVCAAPGGKSLLAARLGGVVESRDISDDKISLIEENIKRLRMEDKVSAKKWDATVDDPSCHKKYDVVIADLPCSGLGIIAKKPEIRYRVKAEDIDALRDIQRNILDTVYDYVKPGGRLVFSTCTINLRENDQNAGDFLKRHTDYKMEEKKQILPKAGECDGFFVTVMKRD